MVDVGFGESSVKALIDTGKYMFGLTEYSHQVEFAANTR